MSYIYGDLNYKMTTKEYQGIENDTSKTIVNNEDSTIEVLVNQQPVKDLYNKLKIALTFKADLEQPKYGESAQLVVPYRELPPIVYLRDSLPESGDEAQAGVLYVLKGDSGEYTAYIWDVGEYDETKGTYGKYVSLFTISYPDLKNRPSINNHVLDGINYIDSDLELQYLITEARKLSAALVEFEDGKTIKEAVEEEKRERVNSDDILQDHIDAEVLARVRADLDNLTKLAEETLNRETADTAISEQKQDKLTAGNGIDIASNNVSVKLGTGLKFNSETGAIELDKEALMELLSNQH